MEQEGFIDFLKFSEKTRRRRDWGNRDLRTDDSYFVKTTRLGVAIAWTRKSCASVGARSTICSS